MLRPVFLSNSCYVCLKFRGIKRTKARLDRATEAMLSSYVATEDQSDGIFANPL